ncbi:tail fiber assembly protein [Paracoccus sp. MBLB3053]|uniref:Tail fiber assembly protein n=1 Tax=Paracoccus aurantius TaxID=3073814 RepID=A0ABU2HT55_9RHOB|nr:tail fiber assembly protein [Paracoccus sp. MBLB3053]MDS9468218.1 tail fiber assembly protein [Paracoccus sp. MBLB3053]
MDEEEEAARLAEEMRLAELLMQGTPNPVLHYAVIAPDGHCILQTGTCPADMIELQGGELLSLEAPEDVTDGTHYWDGEAFAAYPARPGPWAAFDFAARTWTDPRSAADLAAERAEAFTILRIARDRRLAACDWTQVPDNALSEAEREAWRVYRQALRDVPEMTSDPASPTWPVPPAS